MEFPFPDYYLCLWGNRASKACFPRFISPT